MAVQMIYLQRMPTCLNTQKRKLEKMRKYSNNYLKCGFTYKDTAEGQQTLIRQSAKVGELALKPSYQVALRVAQTKKPYIIAESLILPAASDMCRTMFGKEEYVKKTE